jgi:hypothetical protein
VWSLHRLAELTPTFAIGKQLRLDFVAESVVVIVVDGD